MIRQAIIPLAGLGTNHGNTSSALTDTSVTQNAANWTLVAKTPLGLVFDTNEWFVFYNVETDSKPSTRFPSEGLVELRSPCKA